LELTMAPVRLRTGPAETHPPARIHRFWCHKQKRQIPTLKNPCQKKDFSKKKDRTFSKNGTDFSILF
jgi:hypothetical protein